jgi:hypothetical protein
MARTGRPVHLRLSPGVGLIVAAGLRGPRGAAARLILHRDGPTVEGPMWATCIEPGQEHAEHPEHAAPRARRCAVGRPACGTVMVAMRVVRRVRTAAVRR